MDLLNFLTSVVGINLVAVLTIAYTVLINLRAKRLQAQVAALKPKPVLVSACVQDEKGRKIFSKFVPNSGQPAAQYWKPMLTLLFQTAGISSVFTVAGPGGPKDPGAQSSLILKQFSADDDFQQVFEDGNYIYKVVVVKWLAGEIPADKETKPSKFVPTITKIEVKELV